MGRWTEDATAAPDGMQRIGYDSDTHRYTFRDRASGKIYEGDEYGGELRLVTLPNLGGPDDPIRLFPISPTSPTDPNVKSPNSAKSFEDMLPAHLIASAPPLAPPRKSLAKLPSPPSSPSATSESGAKRSMWGVVRRTTVPAKMRSVVGSVMRRSSVGKGQQNSESSGDRSYVRLSNGEGSRDETQRPARDSQPRRQPTSGGGHVKWRTE